MFKRIFFSGINKKKVFFFSAIGFVLAFILGFESSCTFFRHLAENSPAAAKPVLNRVRVDTRTDREWKPNENGSTAGLKICI